MTDNYRNIFSHTAENLAQQGRVEEARELMNWFMEQVPFDTIPGDEMSFAFMAQAYATIGDEQKAAEIWRLAEPLIVHRLKHSPTQNDMQRAMRFVEVIRGSYLQVRDFEGYARFMRALAEAIGDTSYQPTAEEIEQLFDATSDSLGDDQIPN